MTYLIRAIYFVVCVLLVLTLGCILLYSWKFTLSLFMLGAIGTILEEILQELKFNKFFAELESQDKEISDAKNHRS